MSCTPPEGNSISDKTAQALSTAQSHIEINKIANTAVTHMNKLYMDAATAMAQTAPIVEILSEVYQLAADPSAIVTFMGKFVTAYIEPHIKSYLKNSQTMIKISEEMAVLENSYQCAIDRITTLTAQTEPQIPIGMNTEPTYVPPTFSTYESPGLEVPDFSLPSISIPPLPS